LENGLTDKELKELWANLRKENMEMRSPVNKGPLALAVEKEKKKNELALKKVARSMQVGQN